MLTIAALAGGVAVWRFERRDFDGGLNGVELRFRG